MRYLRVCVSLVESEQVRKCVDLQHYLHWLHLEPTHRALRDARTHGRKAFLPVSQRHVQRRKYVAATPEQGG
jgi:hypothetical protein